MTPDQAADVAQRTVAAILHQHRYGPVRSRGHRELDEERVAADLAGLLDHEPVGAGVLCSCHTPGSSRVRHALGVGTDRECPDATRYATGLRRTAALYGVEVPRDDA